MSKQDTEKTVVVFRVYPEGDVLALFPAEIYNDALCMCYQRIGQHGGADYGHCIQSTRPATDEELAPLKRELESIGYNLEIRKRYTRPRG